MKFSQTREIGAPVALVWRALRDPDILKLMIPHCTRIERQPGHRVEGSHDFTMSFEIGSPDEETGAEPIIGWLEVDRQHPPRHLALTLTLNDALHLMRVNGTIDLHPLAEGTRTELVFTCQAQLPEQRGIGWSADAHAGTQEVIAYVLDRLATVVEMETFTATVGVAAAVNQHPHLASVAVTSPQVLMRTELGQIVRLPPVEVPAPTQSMLRRLRMIDARHAAQRMRLIVASAVGGVIILGSLATLWQRTQRRDHSLS